MFCLVAPSNVVVIVRLSKRMDHACSSITDKYIVAGLFQSSVLL